MTQLTSSSLQVFEPTWPLDDHSKLKHMVLDKYLKVWIGKLGNSFDRIIYVDGFAGPGKYSTGEDGSPIMALKIFAHHPVSSNAKITFLLYEADPNCHAHLAKLVEPWRQQLEGSATIRLVQGEFEQQAGLLLTGSEQAERRGKKMWPSFWFVDPFGYKDAPMDLLNRISARRKSEVFIHFMTGHIKRFIEAKNRPEQAFTKVFGDETWKEAGLQGKSDPEDFVRFYKKKLKEKTGFRYLWDFGIQSVKSHVWQHLVFGTKSLEGLEHMKAAMWKVGETGFRVTSKMAKARYDGQFSLLDEDWFENAALPRLRQELLAKFGGSSVQMKQLEEWVTEHTDFCASVHLVKKTLIPMEKDGLLTATKNDGSKRRAGAFAGTTVTFR